MELGTAVLWAASSAAVMAAPKVVWRAVLLVDMMVTVWAEHLVVEMVDLSADC